MYDSLNDVPDNVTVVIDRDGDTNVRLDEGWLWVGSYTTRVLSAYEVAHVSQAFGPFTEVEV